MVSAEDLLQPDPTGALEEETAELVPVEARGGGGLLYPPLVLASSGRDGGEVSCFYAFLPSAKGSSAEDGASALTA